MLSLCDDVNKWRESSTTGLLYRTVQCDKGASDGQRALIFYLGVYYTPLLHVFHVLW